MTSTFIIYIIIRIEKKTKKTILLNKTEKKKTSFIKLSNLDHL